MATIEDTTDHEVVRDVRYWTVRDGEYVRRAGVGPGNTILPGWHSDAAGYPEPDIGWEQHNAQQWAAKLAEYREIVDARRSIAQPGAITALSDAAQRLADDVNNRSSRFIVHYDPAGEKVGHDLYDEWDSSMADPAKDPAFEGIAVSQIGRADASRPMTAREAQDLLDAHAVTGATLGTAVEQHLNAVAAARFYADYDEYISRYDAKWESPDAWATFLAEAEPPTPSSFNDGVLEYVVGADDLVVEGVVYDGNTWQHDGEGGIKRREEDPPLEVEDEAARYDTFEDASDRDALEPKTSQLTLEDYLRYKQTFVHALADRLYQPSDAESTRAAAEFIERNGHGVEPMEVSEFVPGDIGDPGWWSERIEGARFTLVMNDTDERQEFETVAEAFDAEIPVIVDAIRTPEERRELAQAWADAIAADAGVAPIPLETWEALIARAGGDVDDPAYARIPDVQWDATTDTPTHAEVSETELAKAYAIAAGTRPNGEITLEGENARWASALERNQLLVDEARAHGAHWLNEAGVSLDPNTPEGAAFLSSRWRDPAPYITPEDVERRKALYDADGARKPQPDSTPAQSPAPARRAPDVDRTATGPVARVGEAIRRSMRR